MIVLGFDTATPATEVALRLADGTALRAHAEPPPGGHPGHTAQVLASAGELLARAGMSWRELERIAVGVGPGTFTGLRVGIATARGLAQSLGIAVVGVGSLRVLAQAALGALDQWPPNARTAPPGSGEWPPNARTAPPGSGEWPPNEWPAPSVLAMIDARRGEAFLAAYDRMSELAAPRALAPDALAALTAELDNRSREALASGGHPRFERSRATFASGGHPHCDRSRETLAPGEHHRFDGSRETPDSGEHPRFGQRDWLAVGDGALRFRSYLEAIAVVVPGESSPLHRVDAGVLCELAASTEAGDLEAVLPDYRRLPDAEILLGHKGNEK
jgi:tRNA threonylcarbamoyladenosine biosynthesis protein TsaB